MRYKCGAMLLTMNRNFSEWGETFGDAAISTAILDRILHHRHVISIRGDSFRLREQRSRSGLVWPALVEGPNQAIGSKSGGRVIYWVSC
ncbi:MAG TPA: ATP-binding protein [bacterium]|nr:ATP-binding protein [bacterium]